jgi:hypothetical protein
MQQQSEVHMRRAVLSDEALSWAQRVVWAICIGVYLTVFISGIQGGGAELLAVGRAVAFTLATGVLGKLAVGYLSQASLPVEQGPLADQAGPVGSLADLMASANVAEQEDMAGAA